MHYGKADLSILRRLADHFPFDDQEWRDILSDMKHLNLFKLLPLQGVYARRAPVPLNISLFEICLATFPWEGVSALLAQHPITSDMVCAGLTEATYISAQHNQLEAGFEYAGKSKQKEEEILKYLLHTIKRLPTPKWGYAIDPLIVLSFRSLPYDGEQKALPPKDVLQQLQQRLPHIDEHSAQGMAAYLQSNFNIGTHNLYMVALLTGDQKLQDIIKEKDKNFLPFKCEFEKIMIMPEVENTAKSLTKKM